MSRLPDQRHLYDTITKLAGARVGVVGDLVADLYISGLTDRVSREAPVLIVRHEQEWLRPGGAANVAANIAALGATACLVGTVGDDEIGRRLLGELSNTSTGRQAASGTGTSTGRQAASGTSTSTGRQAASGTSGAASGAGAVVGGTTGKVRCDRVIQAPGRSTISKTRFLAGAKLTHRQQVLRLDRQPPESPDDALIARIREHVAAVDRDVDAWVASDYGYGSFNNTLCDLLREIAGRKPVLADSRWELTRFSGLTLLKPNEEEARQAAQALGFCPADEAALATELASKLDARGVLVTLGNKGMVLAVRERTGSTSASMGTGRQAAGGTSENTGRQAASGTSENTGRQAASGTSENTGWQAASGTDAQVTRIPAVGTEEIVDLTGAGDSVAATLATALAVGCDLDTAAMLANHAGGIVVMKEGAATASPEELRESIKANAECRM